MVHTHPCTAYSITQHEDQVFAALKTNENSATTLKLDNSIKHTGALGALGQVS